MARDFEALKARVRDISYTPGTDALRHISPLLLQAQDLTAIALVRLKALDNSTYANIAGSRASLELLASVVSSSSLAGTDLAHVVLANPYEGEQFAGYPADVDAVRTARHAEAILKMRGHLDDAVHQLDLCATGCHYLAHGITEDLTTAQDHKSKTEQQTTGPALTPAQYDALAAERASRQQDLGSDTDATALEEGVTDGCSPWACRGDANAPDPDDFGLAT